MVRERNKSILNITREMAEQSTAADKAVQGLQDLAAFWKARAEEQAALCMGIRSSANSTIERNRSALQNTKVSG